MADGPHTAGAPAPGEPGVAYPWEAGPRWPGRSERLGSVRTAGLLLKETAFPAGSRIPRHEHRRPKVVLTLAGGCSEEREEGTVEVRPSTLQVHPAGSSHAYRAGPRGMRTFSVTLGPGWTELPAGTPREPVVAARDPHLVSLAWRLHQESLARDVSPLVVEELVTLLVDRAGRRRPAEAEPPWLGELLALVHDTFTEARGLSDYATELGVNRSHLARIFRARFRCTLGEYLRGLRLARARLLLVATQRPLAEVAVEAGFSDQSHMGRLFRRLVGATPLAVRRGAAGQSGRKEPS